MDTTKKELLDDIKKDVKRVINEKLKIRIIKLIFTSSYKDHPEIDENCEILKDELKTEFEIIYWGWDTLENKFLDRAELLKKYWSNFIIKSESKEAFLKRNLDLKKQISIDFGDWLNYAPENRKRRSRMILRAFDEGQYPDDNETDGFGEYSWFAAEINSLYNNGTEFIIGIEEIQVYDDYTWDKGKNGDEPAGNIVRVAKVGQINFADIVVYDIGGDEYYKCPHIFCKFQYRGTPFEKTYYYNLNKTY